MKQGQNQLGLQLKVIFILNINIIFLNEAVVCFVYKLSEKREKWLL